MKFCIQCRNELINPTKRQTMCKSCARGNLISARQRYAIRLILEVKNESSKS